MADKDQKQAEAKKNAQKRFDDLKNTEFTLALSFGDKTRGQKVKIGDVAGDDGMWEVRTGIFALYSHVVDKIRQLSGIEILHEQWIAKPSLDNSMHSHREVTVRTPIIRDNGDQEGWTDEITEIGIGTAKDQAGSEYMAKKRALDRATLAALKLFHVYSDSEADALGKNTETVARLEDLETKEQQKVAPFIDDMMQVDTVEALKEVVKTWPEKFKQDDVSDEAQAVLRQMFIDYRNRLEADF